MATNQKGKLLKDPVTGGNVEKPINYMPKIKYNYYDKN